MPEKTVSVPNISCQHCVRTIRSELGGLAGVTSVSADPTTKRVVVAWEEPASWAAIRATLAEIGFPAAEG